MKILSRGRDRLLREKVLIGLKFWSEGTNIRYKVGLAGMGGFSGLEWV